MRRSDHLLQPHAAAFDNPNFKDATVRVLADDNVLFFCRIYSLAGRNYNNFVIILEKYSEGVFAIA